MTPVSPDGPQDADIHAIVLFAREALKTGATQKAAGLLVAISPERLTEEATALLADASRALHLEKQIAAHIKEAKDDKTVTADEASLILTIAEQYLLLCPDSTKVQRLVSQCRNVVRLGKVDDATTHNSIAADTPDRSRNSQVQWLWQTGTAMTWGQARHRDRKALDLYPGLFRHSRKLIAIIVAAVAALLAMAGVAKNARNAFIDAQAAMCERQLSTSTTKLRKLSDMLQADIANDGLQSEMEREIAHSLSCIHSIETIEDELPRAYWINLLDALFCTQDYYDGETINSAKAACDRCKLLAMVGPHAYWHSTGFQCGPVSYVITGALLGLPSGFLLHKANETAEENRCFWLELIAEEQAVEKAERYVVVSKYASQLIRAWAQKGLSAWEIASRNGWGTLAKAIALSDYRSQRQLLEIDRSSLADKRKVKESILSGLQNDVRLKH